MDTNRSPQHIDALAKTLWDYLHLDQPLMNEAGVVTADCVIVCGSNELRVAQRAVELYREGKIGKIIFSGGKTHPIFEEYFGYLPVNEAEAFAKYAIAQGVPESVIIKEERATNTMENMAFSQDLMAEQGLKPEHMILIGAGPHERRVLATASLYFPDVELQVTSPVESFDAYINHPKYRDGRIRALVGHTLRLFLYGQKGQLLPQEIPAEVMTAFRELQKEGYPPLALESLRTDLETLHVDPELSTLGEAYDPYQLPKEDRERSSAASPELVAR